MVAEVNRLVANLLAAGERVALPGVGSLIPVTRPARKISRKRIAPPVHDIDFSSEVEGKSLAEQLAVAASCDLARAEEIYGRWLGHTWADGVLTMEGVGTLKMKHFTPDATFDARLNPEGRTPMVVRRRRTIDWVMWVGVVAILVAAGIAYYGYTEIYQKGMLSDRAESVEAVAPTAEVATTDTVAVAAPAEVVAQESAPAAAAPTVAPTEAQPVQPAQPAPKADATGVMTMQSGYHYVVLGVFSTTENAFRAAAKAQETDGTMRCGVYHFGSKWMVSPFDSEDREACDLYRRAHTDAYPDLWIHTAR